MATQPDWLRAYEKPTAAEPSPREKKTTTDIKQSEASTKSSEVSAATGEAKLPYVQPQAAAELQATLLRNIQLQQDILKSSKGERLGKDERTDLEGLVSGLETARTVMRRFKDNYAGTGFDFPTEIETGVQKKFAGFGTPGQANWWQEMARLDMVERNKYFGASLTNGEKEAWASTTVTPGMDPAVIKENLKRRAEIVDKALGRTVATLRAGGYRPGQIEAALGTLAPQFSPQNIAKRQEYYASEAGVGAPPQEAPTAPEGGRVGGEPIQGFRFTTGAEADITDYVRSPEFTPEGYGALVAQKAVEEGHIGVDQAKDYAARNAALAAETYKDIPAEVRAKVPSGVDYQAIDEAAQENAGLGTIALQAFKNIPESAYQIGEGLVQLPGDAILSVLEGQRVGSVKSVTDLAGELVRQAGGDPKGPMTTALVDAMKERYSDPLKTFSEDPLGLVGDLSVVLTAGGGAAARAPGVIGRAGKAVETAGRVIDPMSAMVGLPEGYRALSEKAPRVTEAVASAPSLLAKYGLGLTTGVPGGEGYGRAFQVGRERGRAGAPTAREQNFVEQMRGASPNDVIAQAEQAVRTMQEQASQAYRSGMVDVSKDKEILDFAGIDRTLADLQNRAYYKGQVKDPRAATVLEKTRALVDEWKGLDPAQFHTPEGMDALKQRIGDIADDLSVANDRKAASIATGVYRAVRKEIADQVPSYDATMRNYEQASDTLREIRKTFSLNPTASVDTQLRKLQSVMRNNANTNYGYREELARLMEERGGVDLLDSLSAQSISSMTPRGLATIPASGAVLTGAGGLLTSTMQNVPSMLDPTMLALLPLTSPRTVGEASYYAGRGLGAAERGVGAVAEKAAPVTDFFADMYNKYPAAALALAQTGSRSEDVENQLLQEMAQRYPEAAEPQAPAPKPDVFKMPAEAPAMPEGSSTVTVDGVEIALPPGVTYDPKTREFVGAGGVRIPAAQLMSAQ